MKIAVAVENQAISGHFGHCDGFQIFSATDGVIFGSEYIASPGHKPGFLPNFLHQHGVNVIIAGGMGAGAIEIFDSHGIKVFTGTQGMPEAAVHKYLEGTLTTNGAVCRQHQHHGECGGHGHD